MELERVGLRQYSLPFDWIISEDFQLVLKMIENGFQYFTDKTCLRQETEVNNAYYYNKVCKVHFYHDFDVSTPFDMQHASFKEKYQRRIDRFYETISNPTIFIRYCNDADEARFIKDNKMKIETFLKTFNAYNEIVYICQEKNYLTRNDKCYYVTADKNDTVSRKFLKKAPDLSIYLKTVSGASKRDIQKNKNYYYKKQWKKIWGKIQRTVKGIYKSKPL